MDRPQKAALPRYSPVIEVSGYRRNVADGFISLRPAIHAAGRGEVRFRDFRHQALSNQNDNHSA